MKQWITIMVAMCSLAGCTLATPFRGPGYDPEKGILLDGVETVYVGLTLAVLKNDRKLKSVFWSNVKRVEASLYSRKGFIGYSKRTQLLGNRAWTMTVWTDEASLEEFVQSDAHQTAIRESMDALESASFARIEIKPEEIPLCWDRATAMMEAQSKGYNQSK